MRHLLCSGLSVGIGLFATCGGLLKADFLQGQVPEFVMGQNPWNERRLFNPHGVAVDPTSGKVFVSDPMTHRILRFPASVTTSPLALNPAEAEAVLGQTSFYGTGRGFTATQLDGPQGLAFDPAGNLYVADAGNHRVLRFDNAANALSGASSTWLLGRASFSQSIGGSSANEFSNPWEIAIAGDYLAVADTGNHRVQVFHNLSTLSSSASASQSYGTGVRGCSTTAINAPQGVAIAGYGNFAAQKLRLWVADTGNNRLIRFDELTGTPILDGFIFDKVADGVLGQLDFITATRAASPRASNMVPSSVIAVGARVYTGDIISNRILRHDNAAAKSNGADADGVLGQSSINTDGLLIAGRGLAMAGTALWSTSTRGAARFDSPSSAAVIASATSILSVPASTAQVNIRQMAEDRLLHKLYVYEPEVNRLIRRYASCAAFRAGEPAEFTFSINLSNLITVGLNIGGLAAHGGNLTLSDTSNHRVINISNAALVSATVPAQVGFIGQPNASAITAGTNDQGLTRMRSPTALCWATAPDQSALRLYVADTGNHRVLGYLPTFPGIADIFGGVDGVAGTTSRLLNQPKGLAYHSDSGLLFVADTSNHRLLQFPAFTAGSVSPVTPGAAIAVLGQADYTTALRGSGPSQFSDPEALALSPNARRGSSEIFVLDQGNYRVTMFYFSSINLAPPALSTELTFNTTSTTGTDVYPYPSTRNLAIGTIGSLMLEMSNLKHPGSLWISGDRNLTWFQRDFTPTVLAVSCPLDTFNLEFSKRPFYPYEITRSSELQPPPWEPVIQGFVGESLRGNFTESRQGRLRQFYRVRESHGRD